MNPFDWTIVLGLLFVVFGYGAVRARETTTNVDWFLGGRSLPFWLLGVSMFATSVDGGEYIAINGATYQDGLSMISGMLMGVVIGGIVAAFLVVPSMYRAGMFTNAEYLETRFGLATRIISVLVQIQYRTSVLATIAIALHLTLTEVAKLEPSAAWWIVATFAAATTLYAAWGGLKTVAATDLLLGITMLTASIVLWITIWQQVGGWSGAESRIAAQENAAIAGQLLHIGAQQPGQSHPVVVIGGWILISTGYFVVNHTQTMKMFGARSLWDVKMCVLVAGGLIMLSSLFSSTLGIFGRALLPGLENPDLIYPRLVDQYLVAGLKGVVVAGVIASAVSTFVGIGAALSALFTRDIYARLMVPDAADRHYLIVSRAATLVIVAGSFAYVPFILRSENIVSFFVRITSIFVTPLMTVYLMGVLTRVHRRAGIVGLVVGSLYGLAATRLGGDGDAAGILPYWLTEKFAAYLWSTAITAGSMFAASLFFSWRNMPELVRQKTGRWQTTSQKEVPQLLLSPFRSHAVPWWARPGLWAALLLSVSVTLVFYVFW